MRPFLLVAAFSLMAVGCQSGHIPNPNDPADVGPLSPATVRGNLRAVTDSLETRLAAGEITPSQYGELVAKAAKEIVEGADLSNVPPAQAWEFGEVLKDARQWRLAEPVLRAAVDYAVKTKNWDRRVNDSLRLATVLAHEGKVPEAIRVAKSVFGAPPAGTAPILLGTYMEVVPAARGKGHDLELGQLVEAAIGVEMHTVVDRNSEAGKAFLAARPYHVGRAWEEAAELYDSAGRHDLAAHARDAGLRPSPRAAQFL